MRGANRSGAGAKEPAIVLYDPGSELRLVGGREKRRAKITNGMEKCPETRAHFRIREAEPDLSQDSEEERKEGRR